MGDSFAGRVAPDDGRRPPHATPAEIADVAVFLVGDAAADVAGSVLLANGGRFTV